MLRNNHDEHLIKATTTTSRKLLVAFDSTEHSKFTLNWVLKHCAVPGDTLILFHAYEVDTAIISGRISDEQIQQLHLKVRLLVTTTTMS